MKKLILGINDYHTAMNEIVTKTLQKFAGYKPKVLKEARKLYFRILEWKE